MSVRDRQYAVGEKVYRKTDLFDWIVATICGEECPVDVFTITEIKKEEDCTKYVIVDSIEYYCSFEYKVTADKIVSVNDVESYLIGEINSHFFRTLKEIPVSFKC